MDKPLFDFERPLSWSSINGFEWSKEEWYRKYILKQEIEPSREMIFGKQFAESIENGTCKYPGLMKMLQKKKEHKLSAVYNGIPLIGYVDAFDDRRYAVIDELKTGKKPWDQERANKHGQLDMYLFMNYIVNRVKPENVTTTLYWLPTCETLDQKIVFREPKLIYPFAVKKTLSQVLKFGTRIEEAYAEMQRYTLKHR